MCRPCRAYFIWPFELRLALFWLNDFVLSYIELNINLVGLATNQHVNFPAGANVGQVSWSSNFWRRRTGRSWPRPRRATAPTFGSSPESASPRPSWPSSGPSCSASSVRRRTATPRSCSGISGPRWTAWGCWWRQWWRWWRGSWGSRTTARRKRRKKELPGRHQRGQTWRGECEQNACNPKINVLESWRITLRRVCYIFV